MRSSGSKAERELLKAIFRLSSAGSAAHTSDVAERLGVTPGTVTVGIKRLADRGLVVHRPYKGVELTSVGYEVAVAVIRRHRIVERFLADYLGYSWKEADELATTFEHQIPDEVEHRIYEALGMPDACPHGFPIPRPDANEVVAARCLGDLAVGDTAVVAIPGDVDAEIVEYLDNLGVKPGVVIELRDRQPLNGLITLRVAGEDHTVGKAVADNIYITVDPLGGPNGISSAEISSGPAEKVTEEESRVTLERSN